MTIYGSYIHFRNDLISWKKLSIDPKIELPALVPYPMKEHVCWYAVAINTVSKLLKAGFCAGHTKYDPI